MIYRRVYKAAPATPGLLNKLSSIFTRNYLKMCFNTYVPLWDPGFIKFQQKLNFVPWIGEQPYTEILFWQFSNIIIYVKTVGKILDRHLNVWVFSNPWDNVKKRWKTTGQIYPVLSTRIWTLSPGLENNHSLKCWSGIFPTILNLYEYVGKLPEQHFSVWLFFNPGDKILFLLKFYEARISE